LDDYRKGIGFAIGTGLVPGVVAFLVVAITSDRFVAGLIAGIAVWAIVSATFYYRARRPAKRRRR
jgi:tetrahydromethanopterin S-methyltransferase subunit C